MTFQYFAYGSNMLALRLQKRCPSAVFVATATAEGYAVNFSKLGGDVSGKGALFEDQGSTAQGVVYEIAKSDLKSLDAAEGVWFGYDRRDDLSVVTDSGKSLVTTTYLPPVMDIQLKPYGWYLALVVAGAIENKLPKDYIQTLMHVPYLTDKNMTRPSRLDAIDTLLASGHEKWLDLLKVPHIP